MAKLTYSPEIGLSLSKILEGLLKKVAPPHNDLASPSEENEEIPTNPPKPVPTPACIAWLRSTGTPYAATMADVLEHISAGEGTAWDASIALSWLSNAAYEAHLIRERDRERGEALIVEMLHLDKLCRFLALNGEKGEPRGIYRPRRKEPKGKVETELKECKKVTEPEATKPQKEWCQLELWGGD